MKTDLVSMDFLLAHASPCAAILLCAAMVALSGCGPSEVKPVELFPEDMCAFCRMAISDHHCASEIISESGDVFKFDDIECLEAYRSGRGDLKIAAVFVKDYEQKVWLQWEKAVIVETDVFTPMGSGKAAFADSARAMEFKRLHPAGGGGL